MRRFIAILLLAIGISTVPATAAQAKGINCNVKVLQPVTFWTRGAWFPEKLPHGMTVEDWFWECSGRMRVKKIKPNRPDGPWGATIRLNIKNCTYEADESWLRDRAGWKNAHIYVSPWPA